MQQEKFDQLWSKCDFTEQALKGLVNCAFESRVHWISYNSALHFGFGRFQNILSNQQYLKLKAIVIMSSKDLKDPTYNFLQTVNKSFVFLRTDK